MLKRMYFLQKLVMVPLKKKFASVYNNVCNVYKFFYWGRIYLDFGLSLAPFLLSLSGGFRWLPLVSGNFRWFPMVSACFPWLSLVIAGYPWLPHGHFNWPRLQKISANDGKDKCKCTGDNCICMCALFI